MATNQVRVELITRDFNRMLEEFASIEPRIEFRDIVYGVAVRVMAGALRRTRAAVAEKIRSRHESREWTTLEGKKYKLSWYLHDDALWGRIENFRAEHLKTKLAARGLSKKSWYQDALQLGGAIDVPAYVAAASYKGRDHPENASHYENGSGANFALTVINTSPIVQKAGGREALISAMAGETRYFFTLLAKGAFRTAESRAARYPSVYVRPSAAATLPA